jgi:hypothetical protein
MTCYRHTLVSLALMAACSGAATNGSDGNGGAAGGGAAGAVITAGSGGGSSGASGAAGLGGASGAAGTAGTSGGAGLGGVGGAAGTAGASGGSAGTGGADGQAPDLFAPDASGPDVSSDAGPPTPTCEPGRNMTCNEDLTLPSMQGVCQPNSTCSCYDPNVVNLETGKCHQKHVCTPGVVASCNDDPALSAIEGTCQPDSSCVCGPGYDKNTITRRCTVAFRPTLPPPCVTVDDCCVTSDPCGSPLFLVGKSELDAMTAWLRKVPTLPPGVCSACMTAPVKLECVGGFCVGTALPYGSAPDGAHCGSSVAPVDSGLGVTRQPLSIPPAPSADAGVDAGVVKSSWGCGG